MRCIGRCIGLCAGLAILALLGAPVRAQQHLTADTAITTAAGASFTAPADWRLTESAALRLLEPPEGDSHLAVVDVQAADPPRRRWLPVGRPTAPAPTGPSRSRCPRRPTTVGRSAISIATRPRPTRRRWPTRWPGAPAANGRS
jgi:hypothetical protein